MWMHRCDCTRMPGRGRAWAGLRSGPRLRCFTGLYRIPSVRFRTEGTRVSQLLRLVIRGNRPAPGRGDPLQTQLVSLTQRQVHGWGGGGYLWPSRADVRTTIFTGDRTSFGRRIRRTRLLLREHLKAILGVKGSLRRAHAGAPLAPPGRFGASSMRGKTVRCGRNASVAMAAAKMVAHYRADGPGAPRADVPSENCGRLAEVQGCGGFGAGVAVRPSRFRMAPT
jgi:hypothetical protein